MSGNDQYGRRPLLWGDTAEIFGFTFDMQMRYLVYMKNPWLFHHSAALICLHQIQLLNSFHLIYSANLLTVLTQRKLTQKYFNHSLGGYKDCHNDGTVKEGLPVSNWCISTRSPPWTVSNVVFSLIRDLYWQHCEGDALGATSGLRQRNKSHALTSGNWIGSWGGGGVQEILNGRKTAPKT